MNKTIKRTILTAAILLLVLGFAGCSLFSGLPSILGTVLPFSKDGLVKEDITYTLSLYTQYTFAADGSYTEAGYTWDTATEAWYLSNGKRGTYSYNTDTYILTLTITDDYDLTTGISGAWAPDTDYPYTESFPAYFTSQNYYGDWKVFVADPETENSWNYSYTYTDADNDNVTKTYIKAVVPEPGGAVSINYVFTDSPSGVETSKIEENETGTIDNIFPADTKFKKGKTITSQFVTEKSTRTWAVATGWSTATITTGHAHDETLVHLGEVILRNPDLDPARVLKK